VRDATLSQCLLAMIGSKY